MRRAGGVDLPRPEPDRRHRLRRELFTALIPLKLRWGGLATTTLAWDDELLDLAARSGCRGLLIGFESLNAESLAKTHKAFNLRQDYRHVVRAPARARHRPDGLLRLRLRPRHAGHVRPRRSSSSIESHIDLPRYAILSPFPGTPLFHRLKAEGRILTEDWWLYDGQHVVFRARQMTPEELLRDTERAWKKTYSYRSIARRLLGRHAPADVGHRPTSAIASTRTTSTATTPATGGCRSGGLMPDA